MIPKIIHLCWLSGEEYPEKIKKCLDSWHTNLPDYEIILWDRKRFDINSTAWTKESFEVKKYAFAADYIRFYALYNYGGIYLDSDVEVLKSFDDLLDNKFFWGFEYTGCPEAAVVGAIPGQKWIRNCLDWYESHSFSDLYKRNRLPIAPLVMRSSFEDYYDCRTIDDNKTHKVYGGIILPYRFFSPKSVFSNEIYKNDDTYTIHHFTSSWIDNVKFAKLKNRIHVLVIKAFSKRFYNAVTYYILKMIYRN